MRETTRCRKIVENIKPLVEWLKANKPGVTSIAVYKSDWLYLLKVDPEVIRTLGFTVTKENGLAYDGLRLRPVTQQVTKEKG